MPPSSKNPSDARRRDSDRHRTILKATLELLLEVGYQRLSIESVARRAKVGKTTIYRWWKSKGELVIEAAAEHLEIGSVPDTGTSWDDLIIAVDQLIKTFTDPVASVVIFAVLAHLDDNPILAATFRERWVMPWRQSLMRALERARSRGDLGTNSDIPFLMDVIVGTVFQRTLVVPSPLVDGLTEHIATLVLPQGPG